MKAAASKIVEQHIACPVCPSSDAYCTYEDGHGHCYSCGYHYYVKDNMDTYTYEYLPWRGITKDTMKHYDVRTKIDAEGKPISIGFKYPNGKYKIRLLASKDFYWEPKGAPHVDEASERAETANQPGLFGRDHFTAGASGSIIITEGEIDALSCYQTLHIPSVSVRSSVTAGRDCALSRSYLNAYERIYLAFDNDSAGRQACQDVARLFDYNKVLVLDFDRRKDANDFLQENASDELRNIFANAKRFLPETVVAINAHTAAKILTEQRSVGVPYPFSTLNKMTYGMRRGESVLITAQEGVGKTELMHAIEYQLLQETDDAVGAFFLEEPKRRHLEALAASHLKRPAHLPDGGCTENDILVAVQEACKRDDRLHVYSHFGSDDPEILLDTCRFVVSARNVGWLLVDHIGMVVSGLGGEDERRALDYISTRLEMMVKELNFGLIIVSHVNDFGQTRGSRYISKIADIRLDISRDILNPDDTIRNTTKLCISKNRFSGMTGPAGEYLFDPFTRQFSEMERAT